MRVLALTMFLLLAACATGVPDAIREPPPEDLSLAEVSRKPDAYQGRRVRWGGVIAGVENRPQETLIDVVARPLDGSGRPRPGDTSLGRFVARVQGFVDPAVYRQGRDITVAGTVDGSVTRLIGQYPYAYVVVDADTWRLWEPQRPAYYRDPYYYDPFYDPFWRSRFYPWHPWYGPGPFHPLWW